MATPDPDESFESHGSDIGTRTTAGTGVREWILVDADRLLLAGAISIGTFALLLALNAIGIIAFVNDDSVTRLAGGMIAGTFSLVTLVVTINQLILSREFTAAGESESKLEGVLSFRDEVADVSGVPVTPAAPVRIFELLLRAMHDRADTLATATEDLDGEVASQVIPYAHHVQERADTLHDTLEDRQFGTFQTLSATVDYDDAWQLYAARHFRERHGEDLPPDATEALEGLIEALKRFSVARSHLKTTYLQRELTRFSQLAVYCGVPAVLAAMLVGFLYADVAGPAIPRAYLPVVVSGLIAVIVSPLALLASYILRTAVLTRRTASIGPMIPQMDPGDEPFSVTYGEESRGD